MPSSLANLPPDRRIDRREIEDSVAPVNSRGKAAFFEACGFSLARVERIARCLARPRRRVG
jgi:hypothetical protein